MVDRFLETIDIADTDFRIQIFGRPAFGFGDDRASCILQRGDDIGGNRLIEIMIESREFQRPRKFRCGASWH